MSVESTSEQALSPAQSPQRRDRSGSGPRTTRCRATASAATHGIRLTSGKHEHDTDKYNFDGSHSSQSVLVREDSAKSNGAVSTSMPVEGSRNTTISDSTRSTSKVRATVRTRTAKVNSRATMIPVIARHTTTIPATGGVPGQCRPVPAGCRDAGRDHKREDRPRRIA